jgi:hypothetical protein
MTNDELIRTISEGVLPIKLEAYCHLIDDNLLLTEIQVDRDFAWEHLGGKVKQMAKRKRPNGLSRGAGTLACGILSETGTPDADLAPRVPALRFGPTRNAGAVRLRRRAPSLRRPKTEIRGLSRGASAE